MLEILFSLRITPRVFEKPLPIRRPSSYDTDGRASILYRDIVATLRQKR
jgi:hypothetical protein